MELGKVYEIVYYDHQVIERQPVEEAVNGSNCLITTYGRLVGITPRYIVLAWNHNGSDTFNNDFICIYKDCIKKKRRLY